MIKTDWIDRIARKKLTRGAIFDTREYKFTTVIVLLKFTGSIEPVFDPELGFTSFLSEKVSVSENPISFTP